MLAELVLFAARHHKEGDPVLAAIGAIITLVCVAVLMVREMGASYNVVTKRGVPHCPLCGRQVSFRRDHCRSCGYSFKSYGSSSRVSTARPPPSSSLPRPSPDPWLSDALASLCAGLGAKIRVFLGWIARFVSCSWLVDLPDWGQPIAWAALASGIVAAPLLWMRTEVDVGVVVLSLAWAALGVSAIARVAIAYVRSRPARSLQKEDEAIPAFVGVLTRELKSRSVARFDVAALAVAEKVSSRAATIAAKQVYSRYARTIVADGVITGDERARIDRLASLLSVPCEDARQIEEAARVQRYHEALAVAWDDGILTPEEAESLSDLRLSLGIPESS